MFKLNKIYFQRISNRQNTKLWSRFTQFGITLLKVSNTISGNEGKMSKLNNQK